MYNFLISIIIPVYNAEKYLSECIDSVINQTLKDIEIICIDDGSSDSSNSILKKYCNNDSRIKIITTENQGVSAARNLGIEIASGEYIMFVDSDDWIDINTCEEMYNNIKFNNVDACMCDRFKEYGKWVERSHCFTNDKILFNPKEIHDNIIRRLIGPINEELKIPYRMDRLACVVGQLFKTEICKKIKFESITSSEDLLFQLEYYSKVKTFSFVDKPFYHYRKYNSDSTTHNYQINLIKQRFFLLGKIKKFINIYNYDNYLIAYYNRVSISLIAMGINEVRSNIGCLKQIKNLKNVLKNNEIIIALKELKISYMPLYWKIFFILCKKRLTLCWFILLKIMNFITYIRLKYSKK